MYSKINLVAFQEWKHFIYMTIKWLRSMRRLFSFFSTREKILRYPRYYVHWVRNVLSNAVILDWNNCIRLTRNFICGMCQRSEKKSFFEQFWDNLIKSEIAYWPASQKKTDDFLQKKEASAILAYCNSSSNFHKKYTQKLLKECC